MLTYSTGGPHVVSPLAVRVGLKAKPGERNFMKHDSWPDQRWDWENLEVNLQETQNEGDGNREDNETQG